MQLILKEDSDLSLTIHRWKFYKTKERLATFQEIIKGEKPVLVDFHADWCNPCKIMNPILKSIKKHFGDNIKILKINVDKNEKVAGKFQVREFQLLFYLRNVR